MREVEVELAASHQGYATPMPVEGSRKVRRLRGTPCPLWVELGPSTIRPGTPRSGHSNSVGLAASDEEVRHRLTNETLLRGYRVVFPGRVTV